MDDPTARSVALIAAAISRIGTGVSPAQLKHEAAQYVPWIRPRSAARMLFTIKGDPLMPLTVDSAASVAVLSFEDDHGDAVPVPAGALATAVSSDTAVLTVGAAVAAADANGVATLQFPLTEGTAGDSTLSVTVTDAGGNPLLGPDGATAIPVPAPVVVTVDPGAAAAEKFTVPGN